MIRFLCREIDESPLQADSPSHKTFKTFDDAQAMELWLRESLGVNKYSIWVRRELLGIELLPEVCK